MATIPSLRGDIGEHLSRHEGWMKETSTPGYVTAMIKAYNRTPTRGRKLDRMAFYLDSKDPHGTHPGGEVLQSTGSSRFSWGIEPPGSHIRRTGTRLGSPLISPCVRNPLRVWVTYYDNARMWKLKNGNRSYHGTKVR